MMSDLNIYLEDELNKKNLNRITGGQQLTLSACRSVNATDLRESSNH